MIKPKYIVHLIDFLGHPTITGTYLNERRFEALKNLVKYKDWKDKVFVNTYLPDPEEWTEKHKYKEQFLELKTMAEKEGAVWIDVRDDTDVFQIVSMLRERGYEMNPSHTRVIIGGTNLSGCVLKNKASCVETYAKDGFKTLLLLPLSAECESTGINDLEKTWSAISKVYTHVVENNIQNLVELHHDERRIFK